MNVDIINNIKIAQSVNYTVFFIYILNLDFTNSCPCLTHKT